MTKHSSLFRAFVSYKENAVFVNTAPGFLIIGEIF
jgi:hypothetical protein